MTLLSDDTQPTTYSALAALLHDTTPSFISPEDIASIDRAATDIALVQDRYKEYLFCDVCCNEVKQVSHLRSVIGELEAVGVRGWMVALTENSEENLSWNAVEEAQRREVSAAGLRNVDKNEDETGDVEKFRGLVDRLEAQVTKLGSLIEEDEHGPEFYDGELHTPLRSISEDFGKTSEGDSILGEELESLRAQQGSPRAPLRRTTRFSRLPTTAEVDSMVEATGGSAVFQLKIDETKGNDTNAELHETKNLLWDEEEKERDISISSSRLTVPQLPTSTHATCARREPAYIYITLPANFSVPQRNPRRPSLTFLSPASVFYFPHGATRDEVLRILRQKQNAGISVSHLEPIDDVNVIMIRTHEMEWELKNAIRKIMTPEEWRSKVGNQWYTEGLGATFIVSKPDVYFHDVSESIASGSGSDDGNFAASSVSRETNDSNRNQEPRLRGGASSSSHQTNLDFDDLEQEPQSGFSFQDYLYTLGGVPLDEEHFYAQAWVEYARALQLQNASQERMIERLEEIVQDTEGTIEWQDQELDHLHNRIVDLECEIEHAKKEAELAKQRADTTKAKTRELKKSLRILTNRARAVSVFDGHGMDMHIDPIEWSGPQTPSLRGGSGTSLFQRSPNTTGPHRRSKSAEPSTQGVDAKAFYFFPTVSMIVLLMNPLRYFQWPRRTTLAQIRDDLEFRHSQNLGSNAYLRQVRDIFWIREEMGIPLPDTSGRQVLIEFPNAASNNGVGIISSEQQKPIYDRLEDILLERLKDLKVPAANDRSHLSPPSSGENESFYDAGDLINEINNEVDTSLEDSSWSLCGPRYSSPVGQRILSSCILTARRHSSFSRTQLPLPLNVLPDPFPSRISGQRTSDHEQKTRSVKSKFTNVPHPARMPGGKLWNVVRFPPDDWTVVESVPEENWNIIEYDATQPHGHRYKISELDRSANFDYELGIDDQRLPSRVLQETAEENEDDDESGEVVRHRKGEMCESWVDERRLDPERTRCTFCHVPFIKQQPTMHNYNDKISSEAGPSQPGKSARGLPKRSCSMEAGEHLSSSSARLATTATAHLKGGSIEQYAPFNSLFPSHFAPRTAIRLSSRQQTSQDLWNKKTGVTERLQAASRQRTKQTQDNLSAASTHSPSNAASQIAVLEGQRRDIKTQLDHLKTKKETSKGKAPVPASLSPTSEKSPQKTRRDLNSYVEDAGSPGAPHESKPARFDPPYPPGILPTSSRSK